MELHQSFLAGDTAAIIGAVRRGERLSADQRQLFNAFIGVVRRIYGFNHGETPQYRIDNEYLLKDPAALEQFKMLLRIYDEEVTDFCRAVTKFDTAIRRERSSLQDQMDIITSSPLHPRIKACRFNVEVLRPINKPDQLAIFSAIYQGSGYVGDNVVRLRMLTGPEGAHHGLRPIRGRIVGYVVDMEVVRFWLRLREAR
jgi:hypothetical protein